MVGWKKRRKPHGWQQLTLDSDDQQPSAGGLGKLIGDVPSATAILDRFLPHAEIIPSTDKSYLLKDPNGKRSGPNRGKSSPLDDQ